MAYSKHSSTNNIRERGITELPTISRLPSFPFYDKLQTTENPLPGMSVFSHKRKLSECNMGPAKLPKTSTSMHFPSTIPSPLAFASHNCTPDCRYCSNLTNLDIAAYYWSKLAMRGYSQFKQATRSEYAPSFTSTPSPTSSVEFTFSKPPSPSGSLSSMDLEPSSPSASITSDYSIKESSNLGTYQCQFCQKCYSHPRLLNRHLQSHTPFKKHHCSRCRKGFNDAFDLKRHIRTHTGIKPFQCDLCEKSFTQRCSLEAHMTRVHNISQKFAFRERRPKLYVCEDCGITFKDNAHFRQHEKDGKCDKNLKLSAAK